MVSAISSIVPSRASGVFASNSYFIGCRSNSRAPMGVAIRPGESETMRAVFAAGKPS